MWIWAITSSSFVSWLTYISLWIAYSSAFSRLNPTVSCWCWCLALIGADVCRADRPLPYLAMRKNLCTGSCAGRKLGGDQNEKEPIGVRPHLTGPFVPAPCYHVNGFFSPSGSWPSISTYITFVFYIQINNCMIWKFFCIYSKLARECLFFFIYVIVFLFQVTCNYFWP